MKSFFASTASGKESVYLIKNGDLHKIGITSNFKRRMRELRPDHIQACLSLDGDENFTAADIERTLHARFKHLRIPQTEYFRLETADILECCNLMKSFSNQSDIPLENYITEPESQLAYEVETGLKRLQKKAARLDRTLDLAIEAGDEEWLKEVQSQGLQIQEELNEFKEKHKDVLAAGACEIEEDCDEELTDPALAQSEADELNRLREELKVKEELLKQLQKSRKSLWPF